MTPDDRILLRCMHLLVMRWFDQDSRDVRLGLMSDALREVRRDGPLGALIDAAEGMVAARSPIDWARAVEAGRDALVRLHESDLTKAVTARVAASRRMQA